MSHDGADPVRTVTVEFLRPGPPHNQLLSPLTRYLAVCGDGRVGEVNVPYEHSEFVRRLRELRYLPASEAAKGNEKAALAKQSEGNQDRQAALIELSKHMSQLLSAVPGLSAQLSSRHCGSELVHLQFVVTAAELAMLPFELAGTLEQPGSDPNSYLQLSAKPLISMTRRSRGIKDECVKWPTRPRILFVAADPERPVPYEQHVDALIRALQPWLPPLEVPSTAMQDRVAVYDKQLSRHLVILKRATISRIAKLCAENEFTHVHVLAHGANDPNAPGRHFGLALHGEQDEDVAHIVSGAQFASAIRRDGGKSGPTVVTLSACDSGNVHDVMYTGASFAHELHRSGVPVVVASQFPLSVAGSPILAEHLYAGLLRGKDPRDVLYQVRLALHSAHAGITHDWASLVTYAAFPPDFAAQLEEMRHFRGREAINAALAALDVELSRDALKAWKDKPEEEARAIKEGLFATLNRAMKLLPTTGRYAAEGIGLLAAAEKRRAEFCFVIGSILDTDPARGMRGEALQCLRRAADTYDKAFREGVRNPDQARPNGPLQHWPLTQQLSLQAVLEANFEHDRWAAASELAKDDLIGPYVVWARTSLIELVILRWWIHGIDESAALENHATELLALTREDKFPLHSTERQLRRYLEWWWTEQFRADVPNSKPVPEALSKKVEEVADRLDEHRNRGPL